MAVIYDMSHVDTMEGHEFEQFIANLLRKLAYQKVEVTPGSGDQGVDVLAEKDGVRYAIQCKCYSSDLGNTPIQEVNTGKIIYHCHVGVVVTNRYFTQGAQEAAKATGVLLWDRSKLVTLIAQAGMGTNDKTPMRRSDETLTLWSGSPLLRRGGIALKDRDWKKAHQFFDRVLNTDPENAEAYLGLAMAEMELSSQFAFTQMYINDPRQLQNNNFYHAKEFAGPELKAWFADLEKKRKKKEAKDAAELERKIAEAEAERKRREAEATAERKRKEAEAEEQWQQKAAERYAAAKKQEQMTCDSREADDLFAAAQLLHATAKKFRSLGSYQDSLQRAEACEQQAVRLEEEANVRAEHERFRKEVEAKRRADKNKKISIITATVALVAIIISVVITKVIVPGEKYKEAELLLANREYSSAAISFGELGNYRDAHEKSVSLWNKIATRETISAGGFHTVGLTSEGTVIVTGDQPNPLDWTNIIAVSAGQFNTIGLKADGTVMEIGSVAGYFGVSDWADIVAVDVGFHNVTGLKADGTVVIAGMPKFDLSKWKNIIAVAVGYDFIVGLKTDGTVAIEGSNKQNISNWVDIVAISSSNAHIAGLKADGTVVVDSNTHDVSAWSNITAISVGGEHIVGLKADGTVVATGSNDFGACDVSDWTDIVAISAGNFHTVGLKADGTVVATEFIGNNAFNYGQCNVDKWIDIVISK